MTGMPIPMVIKDKDKGKMTKIKFRTVVSIERTKEKMIEHRTNTERGGTIIVNLLPMTIDTDSHPIDTHSITSHIIIPR